MNFPTMVRIEQHFSTTSIKNIPETVRSEIRKIKADEFIGPDDSVAITAGSRGIANMAAILAEVIGEMKKIGTNPFIVPAMGSHGNATAEGQKQILEHYGITQASMGAPIKSSMQTVPIGTTSDGVPVQMDKHTFEADHIIVINRVKPHTDFKADIESGLMKMMAIGLGNQKAADHYHRVFIRLGHFRVITSVAREIMRQCPIAFGLAVVENQRDETEIIQAIPPNKIEATEHELLVKAKASLPYIPFDPIDILIVDQMGKDISGTGMDQNVIGRAAVPYHRVPAKPKITRILVRDLSVGSKGNAIGIGNADFVTKRLVDKIDHQATYMNAITSSCPEIVRIPPHLKSDQEVLNAAFQTIEDIQPQNVRIVHIRDTLHLEKMYISDAILSEAKQMQNISIIGSAQQMSFDQKGNLISGP